MSYRVIGFVCFLLLLISFIRVSHFSVNQTASLPYKYFVSLKSYSYEKGDLVLIKSHEVKYVGKMSLIKRVVGVEGDEVAPLLGKLKSKTKTGKPLTPLKVKTIPKGFVFVNTGSSRFL